VFNYGVIPDPFLHLRSSKVEQMKGIDVLKKYISGTNIFVYVGGKHSKKTSLKYHVRHLAMLPFPISSSTAEALRQIK
jgi:hypothetical protein